MAFYLRKHFNMGPLRINLSKGGVGLSAGVTGARVGLNRKGVYVHGGRHGMYYRKHLKKGQRGRGKTVPGQQARRDDGKAELFVDTGAAYPAPFTPEEARPPEVNLPDLPSLSPRLGYTIGIGLLLSVVLLVAAPPVGGVALLATGAEATRFGWMRSRRNRAARAAWENVHEALTNQNEVSPLLDTLNQALGPAQRRWLHARCYALLLDRLIEDSDVVDTDLVVRFEDSADVPASLQSTLKQAIFAEVVDAVVEDHVLTEEEEEAVDALADRLGLRPSDIAAERAMLNALRAEREIHAAPLTPVNSGVSLKQGEECYYETEARFLVERVQERFQRNNVKYTVRGLEVDMEGTLYLTDRRLLLVGDGTRSYRLRRVLDEELSLHDNTLRLTLDERVSQVIISAPDTHVLAAHLTKVLHEHHGGA